MDARPGAPSPGVGISGAPAPVPLPPLPALLALDQAASVGKLSAAPPERSTVWVPPAPATQQDWSVFDHPTIGGRMTACVLVYGDYPELHRRCLDALLGTTTPDRVAVRVGTNAVCETTATYLRQLREAGRIEKIYWNAANRKKYPVQRDMYHDTVNPIPDKWLFWFDDDSICLRPNWAITMAELIVRHAAEGFHQYGPLYWYTMTPTQLDAIRRCGWYRGKLFRNKHGLPVPNGNIVHFATGSFQAISLEAIRNCDIPEATLEHNGGDVLTGEQIYQGGYRVKNVGNAKTLVQWSSAKRRGLSEKHWRR